MIHVEGSSILIASFISTSIKNSSGEVWLSSDEGLTWIEMANFSSSLECNYLTSIRLSVSQGILYTLTTGNEINDVEVRYCTPIRADCHFAILSGMYPILEEEQGSTNSVILADPTRAGVFYLGGDAATFRLQRCVVSDFESGQSRCETMTGNGTVDGSSPHSDSRCMAFDANDDLLEGDDGGVWKRTIPSSTLGKWLTLSSSLRAVECHSAAYDPVTKIVACGAQDNGVSIGFAQQVWMEIVGGDGANVRLDSRLNPPSVYASSQNFGFDYECSGNGSCKCVPYRGSLLQTFPLAQFPFPSQDVADGEVYWPIWQLCLTEEGFPFYPVYEINQYAPPPTVVMIVLGYNGIYEIRGSIVTRLAKLSTFREGGVVVGGILNGVKNQYVLWAAAGEHGVWFRNSSGSLSKTSLHTSKWSHALSIAQDPTDSSCAYVLTGYVIQSLFCYVQVWKTTDSGSTFTSVTGNMNSVTPKERLASDICYQTLSVVRSIFSTNILIIGGIDGLYYAEEVTGSNSLHWSKVDFFPSVVVTETRVDHHYDFLLVSTLGRGVWRIDSISYLVLHDQDITPSITPLFSPSMTPAESVSASATSTASLSTSSSDSVSTSATISSYISSSPSESSISSESVSFSALVESPSSEASESMPASPSESVTTSALETTTPSTTPSKFQDPEPESPTLPLRSSCSAEPSKTPNPTQNKKTHPVSPTIKSTPSIPEKSSIDTSSQHQFPYIYVIIGMGVILVLVIVAAGIVVALVKRRQYQLLNKASYQQSTLDDPENDSI